MQGTIQCALISDAGFLLARRTDVDIEWAYICSVGLHFDYFKFRKLPKSRRDKLVEIASEVEKKNLEIQAALATGGLATKFFK